MKLSNLKRVYVYKPIKTKVDGEDYTKWQKVIPENPTNENDKNFYFNVQQDIDELDTTPVGTIDYEVLKLRSTKYFELKKNYGICLKELEVDEEGFTITKPDYYIKGKPKIGNTITYICNSYMGE